MLIHKKFIGVALFIGLLLPIATFACIWDHDTLQSEKFRFPDTLELITGKFLRHSKEFYHWRIQDRTTRLKADPTNTSLLDDLAVAYEKTDNHEKAIEIAIEIEKIKPGRYETAANLGTFYLHSGKFKDGLEQIEKAIKINPDAHFGREIYQKILVDYRILTRNFSRKKIRSFRS
jgi:tetratricopeptide (TPR) repeat protein